MILRELLLKLGLDVDEASFAKGQLAAGLIEAGLHKVAEIATEIVEKFVDVIHETAEAGHRLEELAQKTGIETQTLQMLGSAAGATGVDMDTLAGSLGILARNMFAAKNGSDEQAQAFSRLGVKIRDPNGKLRDTSDVLLDLSDRFSTMPDSTQKVGEAMSVLGKRGAALIPFLNKGRDAIREIAGETYSLTEEQIKAGGEIIKTQKASAAQSTSIWMQAIAPLLPAIERLTKRWLAWKKANGAIIAQRIERYIGYVIKAVDMLTTVFDFLVKNAQAVKYIVEGIGIAMVIMGHEAVVAAISAAAAWLAAAAPFLAIAAVIGALLLLFDDIRVWHSGKGRSVFGEIFGAFDELMRPRPGDPWFVVALRTFIQLAQEAKAELKALYDELASAFEKIGGVLKFLPPVVIAKLAYRAGEYVAGEVGNDENWTDQSPYSQARYTGKKASSTGGTGVGVLAPTKRSPTWSGRPESAEPNMSLEAPAPEYRSETGASAGSGVTINAPLNMNVSQLPGESGENFAARVAEIVDDYQQTQLQDAAAAVSR